MTHAKNNAQDGKAVMASTEVVCVGVAYYVHAHPALALKPGLRTIHRDRAHLRTTGQLALAIDEAAAESIRLRGNHGAASCELHLVYSDGTSEPVSSLDDAAATELELTQSTVLDVRRLLRDQRGRFMWDGNNHRATPTDNLQALLSALRTR